MNTNQHAIPRLMRMEDKESIAKLSQGIYVFDGISFDYLPYCFERWMESSTHVCYVLEGENKGLIAFHCDTLLDEGETLFTEGLRTLESMRGTGLRSVLNRFIEEHRFLSKLDKLVCQCCCCCKTCQTASGEIDPGEHMMGGG